MTNYINILMDDTLESIIEIFETEYPEMKTSACRDWIRKLKNSVSHFIFSSFSKVF